MKDELNNYNIANSDGVSPQVENEGKVSYSNDKSDYIRENVRYEQGEASRVAETVDEGEGASPEMQTENLSEEQMADASSASSASTASSAASATASVGGSIGALAGVVAASVAAAVVVAAVFLSTLAISLSLLIADMHSLVFGVTITGAAEEDFAQPIYAILTSDDGTYLEQEVKQDTAMLTFDGLEPGREYRLKVKNENKVFAEVSAFTTTEPNEKGEIVSSMQGVDVYVTVKKAELKASEHYTLIGKDAAGNVVFSKDGVEPFVEYSFKLEEPKDVYFYLTVSGKTYAVSQCLLPEYDLENGVWAWSDDRLTASVTFMDKRGGESLVLAATVTRKTTEASCDKDGSVVYTAKATYEGKTYSDKKTTVLESPGHDYEGVYDGRTITYTCSRCGDSYTNND